MMLMSEYDDAYVDAMLMVNMQANTRSVTPCIVIYIFTTRKGLAMDNEQ